MHGRAQAAGRLLRDCPRSDRILFPAARHRPGTLRVSIDGSKELLAVSSPDLTSLLGFRQAQIMHALWAHGSGTVRELHTALAVDQSLTYNTIMTLCRRLLEKGLLERRRVMPDESAARAKQAYVYTPRVTAAALLRPAPPAQPPFPGILHQPQNGCARDAVEQLLAYIGSLQTPDGQSVDDRALDTMTALLERAESAERAILAYQAEALRALHRAEEAERRAEIAEGLADKATPRPARAKPVPSTAVYEYPGRDRICRVCGRPAPSPSGNRRDGFRVCSLESCRQEARRRDNVTKQRRSVARKRAQQA
jgi:hypothetical protein